MISTINLLHEPQRRRPWVVRWWGNVDTETGKQRRYGRAFRHNREAKAFLIEKQHDLDRGEPRDVPADVTLGQLLGAFEDARLAGLGYASQIGYHNTMAQLRSHFGPTRKIRDIRQRSAEAFVASRKRCDGRPGELSSWSKVRHIIHCRAIFAAAVEWGYVDRNPFRASTTRGGSPLSIHPKARPWHHITPEEFEGLLVEVRQVRHRAACWLMYGSGLRPGEVYNLTVGNIDLQRNRVHVVNRAPSKDIPPFVVKADGQSAESKERSVPIPQAAMPDLRARYEITVASHLLCLGRMV